MDGNGLSGRDRSRIGRLWPGSDNDTTANNNDTTNHRTAYHEAADGTATIRRRDDSWPYRGCTGF